MGPDSKGRPPGKWKDIVREYMEERGATRGEGLIKQRKYFDQGEVEAFMPPLGGTFLEGARCQTYR